MAIEDPTGLRLLDILEDLNVPIFPVACDEHGPMPDALAAALKQRPAMFVMQPRVHAVTGSLLSRERLNALGDLLQDSDSIILENDGIGDVADAPRISLGQRFPDRVIHICPIRRRSGPTCGWQCFRRRP